MCGEHIFAYCAIHKPEGSSPHVRGTRWVGRGCLPPRRIIPACAGNTFLPDSQSCLSRDHPRMCGEHDGDSDFLDGLEGSSPHVRGTLWFGIVFGGGWGIIPACAGNTRRSSSSPSSDRDHPRMCGEHISKSLVAVFLRGSSPHVRGTLQSGAVSVAQQGIIPACAGNTS